MPSFRDEFDWCSAIFMVSDISLVSLLSHQMGDKIEKGPILSFGDKMENGPSLPNHLWPLGAHMSSVYIPAGHAAPPECVRGLETVGPGKTATVFRITNPSGNSKL